MKELIERLSMGHLDTEVPVLDTSISIIETSVENGVVTDGSFEVFSNNKVKMKGIIFSTNEHFKILNNQFIAVHDVIKYQIDTRKINCGDEINGFINIVSNGGEISIPYNIKVDNASLNTKAGKIKNLFQFTNLVQMEYEDALNLFISDDFVNILPPNDNKTIAIYRSLRKSTDINRGLEEFLVAVNKKSSVNVSLSDTIKEYSMLTEDYGDNIVVTKDNWGYVSMKIEIDGDFIHVAKDCLTKEDFAGSNYELNYVIDYSKLHGGHNTGAIKLIMYDSVLTCNIIVKAPSTKESNLCEIKDCVSRLMNIYLKFRLHKYNLDTWASESMAFIDRMLEIDENQDFVKLIKAQILITMRKDTQAIEILEQIAEQLIENREQHVELYCYYLYVRTVQKRDEDFTAQMLKKVRYYYENGYDNWKVLWVLLYMDDDYDNNQSLKLARAKEQYQKGCRSPLIYYEALDVLNNQPALLRVFDEFEIQVLLFGVKLEGISKEFAVQIAVMAEAEKNYNELLYKALAGLYDIYESERLLAAICSLLIRSDITGEKYFRWYELGVEKGLKITNMYECYMKSIAPDYSEPLPQIILMYFMYNNNVLYDRQPFLYANIINNKTKLQNIYNSYSLFMEKFAIASLESGFIDIYFKSIYKEFLNKSMVTKEISEKLPAILSTYLLICPNHNMSQVAIMHKERLDEQIYTLNEGQAYIQIYTEEPAIVFIDDQGIRYAKTIPYRLIRLLDMDEYMRLCYDVCADDENMMLYFAEKFIKYRSNADKVITLLTSVSQLNKIALDFRRSLTKDIIDYYMDNYDVDTIDDYLPKIDFEAIDSQSRIKAIELMITRGVYDSVYELIERYGSQDIEPRKLVKYCTRYIKNNESELDKVILEICANAFRKGKYTEEMLIYLGKYFNGTTKELIQIWKASNDYNIDNKDLEERLIIQIIFTKAYVGNLNQIFESYYNKGANNKVVRAFLLYKSYEYFSWDKVINTEIFDYLEKELDKNTSMPDLCASAYIKYQSTRDEYTQDQTKLIKRLIYELCSKGIIFEHYKHFKSVIKIPYIAIDKTIVEYKTLPDRRVSIHYFLETGNLKEKNYSVENMRCVYPGVYIKDFLMFYGESVSYYLTEEFENNETLTQSEQITISDREVTVDNSRFGMLNDMMICKDMREETTLKEIALTYAVNQRLAEDMFKLC